MDKTVDRRKWTRTIDSLPPENQEVETKVDDHMGIREKTTLKMIGNLWVDLDETIMDYTPTHWRTIQNKEI